MPNLNSESINFKQKVGEWITQIYSENQNREEEWCTSLLDLKAYLDKPFAWPMCKDWKILKIKSFDKAGNQEN